MYVRRLFGWQRELHSPIDTARRAVVVGRGGATNEVGYPRRQVRVKQRFRLALVVRSVQLLQL